MLPDKEVRQCHSRADIGIMVSPDYLVNPKCGHINRDAIHSFIEKANPGTGMIGTIRCGQDAETMR